MKIKTNPLLMAQKWAQEPNRVSPLNVEKMEHNPFFSPVIPSKGPHPFSIEASWEGN